VNLLIPSDLCISVSTQGHCVQTHGPKTVTRKKSICDERQESMMSITSNMMFFLLDINIKIVEFRFSQQ
jgi:hypothetical protein